MIQYFDYFSEWKSYIDQLNKVVEIIESSENVIIVGNGGSQSIASHVTVDLNLCGYNARCLSTPSVLTAISNDFGYDNVYSKQIETLQNTNGCLIAISSSGVSNNIVNAIKSAKDIGYKVITFSGFNECNDIVFLGDVNIHVDSSDYGVVEVGHMILLHYVVNILKE